MCSAERKSHVNMRTQYSSASKLSGAAPARPGMSQAGGEPRAEAGSDAHRQRALFAVIGYHA